MSARALRGPRPATKGSVACFHSCRIAAVRSTPTCRQKVQAPLRVRRHAAVGLRRGAGSPRGPRGLRALRARLPPGRHDPRIGGGGGSLVR
eukprot:9468582-Pyramimonas_sp.AAC.1